MKKQLLIALLVVSGSLWAMDLLPEDAPQRNGRFKPGELQLFESFCKSGQHLRVDTVKQARDTFPHLYEWATASGDTVLHHLVRNSTNTELLKYMLEDGADPYHCNKAGENAFDEAKRNEVMLAVLKEHEKMIKAFGNATQEERAAFLEQYNKEDELTEDDSGFPGKMLLTFVAGALSMYLVKVMVDKHYDKEK